MIEFKKGRTFAIEDYQPYIGRLGNERLLPLPNAFDCDPLAFLNNLAASGHGMTTGWGYALLPDDSRNQWTMFFLTSYMMSGMDGGGYAVTYGGKGPIVRRFALCKHSKEGTGSIEQEHRGYHPGYCKLCGYNMSYDSGD